jgi:hypothetical protein
MALIYCTTCGEDSLNTLKVVDPENFVGEYTRYALGALNFLEPFKCCDQCNKVMQPGEQVIILTSAPFKHIQYDKLDDISILDKPKVYILAPQSIYDRACKPLTDRGIATQPLSEALI